MMGREARLERFPMSKALTRLCSLPCVQWLPHGRNLMHEIDDGPIRLRQI
jgi:hypothetical protein